MPLIDDINRLQSVMLPVRLLAFFRLFQLHVPAGRAQRPMVSL